MKELETSWKLAIVAFSVTCEVVKQCTSFATRYYADDGQYPVPQTALVLAVELIKLVSVSVILLKTGTFPEASRKKARYSLRFLVPGVCYAVNNNLYLYALTLIAPPVWIILMSMRTVVTTLSYKFILGRGTTGLQFGGAALMVLSILLAKAGDLDSSDSQTVPLTAILIAAFASVNSVAASIFTEIQLKGKESSVDETSFLEKQFWLYFYGSVVALAGHLGNDAGYLPHNFIEDIADAKCSVQMAVMGGILSTSLGGMAVANVLRRLDNVVKEYSASVANIATAVVCSFLFPEAFQITMYLVLSLATLCTGISLYERGRPREAKERKRSNSDDEEKSALVAKATEEKT